MGCFVWSLLIAFGQFNPLPGQARALTHPGFEKTPRHRPAFSAELRGRKKFDFRKPEAFFHFLRRHERNQRFDRFLLEEFPFDTTTVLGAAPGYQELPEIAFDGTNFFVVWDDNRVGTIFQVYGARFTPEGVLLDSLSLPISTGDGDRGCPAVAFDGRNYFVVWMDDRDGDGEFEIYGARVTPTGTVLDPNGIPISTGTGTRWYPSLAFDGTNYFVVWNDDRDGDGYFDIYGARVTPAGEVLEPEGIPICTNEHQQLIFRGVVFGAGHYFVIWMDGRDENDDYPNLYGARVRSDGVVLDTNGRALIREEYNQAYPRLGFDGSNYFAVWEDDREGEGDFRIYGCRIRPEGVVIDSGGVAFTDPYCEFPAVTFDGRNYLVAYVYDYDNVVYGMRITPEGVVIDTGGFIIVNRYYYTDMPLAVAAGANLSLVGFSVWGFSDDLDLCGARVTPDGQVLDPEGALLAYGWRSIEQWRPVAGFDGSNYLVVWEGIRSLSPNLYGTRVSPQGEILDPGGFRITRSEIWQEAPALSYGGNNFLVVWCDFRNGESDIFGARVTGEGVVLDSSGVQISAPGSDDYQPAVASDSTNFLAVWQAHDWLNWKYKICGARVTPEGTVLDNFEIFSNELGVWSPSVVFGGENYLVVWVVERDEGEDIYGARVSRTGTVLDPEGIPIDTGAGYYRMEPAVGFDGRNYFVVYTRMDMVNRTSDIYGKRVNQAGSVVDPQPLRISNGAHGYSPALDFDGAKYLVVWQDERATGADIYGARVLPSGVVVDTAGMELINQWENRYLPKVCRGPGTQEIQHLLTFSGYYSPLSTTKALGAFYLGYIGIGEVKPAGSALSFGIYPNPLPRKGHLHLSVPVGGDLEVCLYYADGRRAKTLFSGKVEAGNRSIPIELENLPAGVYFLNLKTKEKSIQRKILIF